MPKVPGALLSIAVLLLAACAQDRDAAPIVPEAAEIGHQEVVFGATTRRFDGTSFDFHRSPDIRLLELEVSVPANRLSGTLPLGGGDPNPETDFVLTGQTFHSPQSFARSIKDSLKTVPPYQREVTIFVHGFNNTFGEAAFRTAQLKHDIEIPGAMIFYAWPSRGAALGYAYDEDSALFARDGLERLLRKTREATGRPVIVVAHSLGTQLTMEALRQIEIGTPGWSANNLAGVVLMSPDLDVDVFRQQVSRFKKLPQPFVIFANSRDRALGISQRIRGTRTRARLGNISSLDRLEDLPVQVIDTSGLKSSRDLNHFPAANSPTLISLLKRLQIEADSIEERSIDLARLLPGRFSQEGGAVRVQLEEAPAQ